MPALALVGIHKQCSADMSSYIAKLCSALSSYQEVVSLLRDKGIHLNVKTIISISRDVSKRARLALKADEHLVCFNKGKRVVICIYGGRVRVRRKKRGPKTAKGRNRYHGDWREVKLFVIYIIDENGNKERTELPIMDGIIGSAAQIMTLLKDYLASLNLDQADQSVFVADGAQWIWNSIILPIFWTTVRDTKRVSKNVKLCAKLGGEKCQLKRIKAIQQNLKPRLLWTRSKAI